MKLIEELHNSKILTLEYFDLSDADLLKCYAPGKWNNKQLLHHICDAETVLYDRVRRVISEPKQVIWSFEQDDWANHLDYLSMPLCLSKNVYSSVRDAVIYLANTFYISHGPKTFVHSQTGLRSLKDEFDKILSHNLHHLTQIQQSLKL